MRKRWLFALVPGFALGCTGLFAALLLIGLLLLKLIWAWVIPDLFPGAVEQGLVAESLSWWTAFKLAIFVALLGALAGVRRSGS